MHKPCLAQGTKAAPGAPTDSRHFCNDADAKGCTANRLIKGYCNVEANTAAIPPQYRSFTDDPNWGGSNAHQDFCPTFSGYTNGDCRNVASAPSGRNYYGEGYGDGSRCFDSDIDFVVDGYALSSAPAKRPHCYKHRCNADSTLSVWIAHASNAEGGEWMLCADGSTIAPSAAKRGKVYCPASAVRELCTPMYKGCTHQCSRRGNCKDAGTTNARCVCNEGFGGSYCQDQFLPHKCFGHGTMAVDAVTGIIGCSCAAGWFGVDCSCSKNTGASGAFSCAFPSTPVTGPGQSEGLTAFAPTLGMNSSRQGSSYSYPHMQASHGGSGSNGGSYVHDEAAGAPPSNAELINKLKELARTVPAGASTRQQIDLKIAELEATFAGCGDAAAAPSGPMEELTCGSAAQQVKFLPFEKSFGPSSNLAAELAAAKAEGSRVCLCH